MLDLTVNEYGYGTGAVPDKADNRDFVFGVSKPFDWDLGFDIELLLGYRLYAGSQDAFFGPRGLAGWGYDRYKEIVAEVKAKNIPPFIIKPKDQNGSSSCTGQGSSMYLSVINFIETGEWVEFSAKDIYSAINLGYGKGAMLRDAMARCVDPGVATEALVPSYMNGTPPSEDFMIAKVESTPEIEKARKIYESKSYAVISNGGNMQDDMAWAMLLNFGCYGGVIGTNNGTWFSIAPVPPKNGDPLWGHALFYGKAIKDADGNCCWHLNSWGLQPGLQGWQKLTKAYFTAMVPLDGIESSVVFNPWTLVDKSNQLANNPMLTIKRVKFADGKTFGVLIDTPNGTQIIKATNEEQWKSWSKQDSYQLHTVNADGTTDWTVDLTLNF